MDAMQLVPFEVGRLPELMTWFPDEHACRVWGGPGFRYPFTAETFREDAKLDSLATWTLVGDDGRLAGFGQYYLRVARCHLGRLAIAPSLRGRGLGRRLVQELGRVGSAALGTDSLSLFVLPGNQRAQRLYERLGFRPTVYPEPSPQFEDCVYMVAPSLV